MDKRYCDILRTNRVFLLKNMVPDEVLHLLFSDGILTDLMLDNISSKLTTFEKNVCNHLNIIISFFCVYTIGCKKYGSFLIAFKMAL